MDGSAWFAASHIGFSRNWSDRFFNINTIVALVKSPEASHSTFSLPASTPIFVVSKFNVKIFKIFLLTLLNEILYCFTMKWIGTAIRKRRQKTICAAMALLILSGIYANGALASPGCGLSCCCQAEATSMHHGAGDQIQPPAGCCDEIPTMPCNLKAVSSLPISAYTLTNTGADGSHIEWPAGNSNCYRIETVDTFPCHLLDVPAKSQSPPLYLQKSSLRI